MNYIHTGDFGVMGIGAGIFGSFLILAVVWSLFWKGLALWRAAKRGDTYWFIALLLINSLGILEIIYLFAVTGAKMSDFTRSKTHDHSHNS